MSDAMASKPLSVSVRRAANLLDIGVSTMWVMIARGDVETVSLGRKRLVLFASLEALIQKNARPNGPGKRHEYNGEPNDNHSR